MFDYQKTNRFKTVWDKTNIGENYPGITSPLTYSFIKDAYARVYYNFMLLVGVKEKVLAENSTIFANLVGYIKGQIFYNINNWYELLKLLPAYKYNKVFFENMLNPAAKNTKKEKGKIGIKDLWFNRSVLYRLTKSILLTKPLYKKFSRQFVNIYQTYKSLKLTQLDNYQLVASFEKLEKDFFDIWAITIVNDFKVMVYFGLLTRLAKKILKNPNFILNDTYSTKTQPRSITPLKELLQIANSINKHGKYKNLFTQDAKEILKKLNEVNFTELNQTIQKYCEQYGERTKNELKLEEVNFKENPTELINLIKYYLTLKPNNHLAEKNNIFTQEKTKTKTSLPDKMPLIYKREEYRLKRAKAFQIAREMFLEMGKRMKKAGDLKKIDDVFFLYKAEIFDYLRFHQLKTAFNKLVTERKTLLKEEEKFILPRRIITYGLPNEEIILDDIKIDQPTLLKGQATSIGFVKNAEIIVMPKLDLNVDIRGKILVTSTTDPGWTIIFPLLKGVITEMGGVLSHASIVARELGIPCIVKIPNVTQILQNGDRIEMNAYNGQIKIIK